MKTREREFNIYKLTGQRNFERLTRKKKYIDIYKGSSLQRNLNKGNFVKCYKMSYKYYLLDLKLT